MEIQSPAQWVLSEQPRASAGIAGYFPFPTTHCLRVGPASTGETIVLLLTHSNPKIHLVFISESMIIFFPSVSYWLLTTLSNQLYNSIAIWRSNPGPNSAQGKKPLTATSRFSDHLQFFSIYMDARFLIAGTEETCLFLPFPWCKKNCLLAGRACWIPLFWDKQMNRDVCMVMKWW